MKLIILISISAFLTSKSYSQLPQFSPTGTMTEINFSFDTIIATKIITKTKDIQFSKLDTSEVSNQILKNILGSYLLNSAKTGFEYYYSFNSKDSVLTIKVRHDNKLNGIQIVKTKENQYKPISYITTMLCGVGWSSKEIHKGDLFIFKKQITLTKENQIRETKIKLSKKLISKSFKSPIDESAFFINTKDYQEYLLFQYHIYFMDKLISSPKTATD
ncbi:MAG: hypothetical protein IPP96_17260 [Chitinophagaceae bacterium]|nr:hypothetical protein [Chitinophagaceae bacterium]